MYQSQYHSRCMKEKSTGVAVLNLFSTVEREGLIQKIREKLFLPVQADKHGLKLFEVKMRQKDSNSTSPFLIVGIS